ncbi:Rossmann-like and DUF2520 domain-containing protein [Microbacterium sp.]|uniref:Rossmann-like and DUF2520 domain-containing protein n=1 Tax=Microbacterium sp. TaxID=51671 RepID=UPI00262A0A1F|nr:Rossmann-like and DUF2520 domain-containing protein [Microbacterium sp.]
MPTPVAAAPASLAVIGDGRLGGVLAAALRAVPGLTVYGPLGRGEEVPAVDIALLCVPDAEISAAARLVRPRAQFVGHVSGATPLDDVDFSLHPLQTFTGAEDPDVFRGIGCAIDGRTDAARARAADLAAALGGRAFVIGDEHRAEYHAAASLASNLLLTVLDATERVATSAGLEPAEARMLLGPLVRQSVANWEEAGARAALTGPIARGDEQTVARQRAAVVARERELGALFDELCASARVLAAWPGSDERVVPAAGAVPAEGVMPAESAVRAESAVSAEGVMPAASAVPVGPAVPTGRASLGEGLRNEAGAA